MNSANGLTKKFPRIGLYAVNLAGERGEPIAERNKVDKSMTPALAFGERGDDLGPRHVDNLAHSDFRPIGTLVWRIRNGVRQKMIGGGPARGGLSEPAVRAPLAEGSVRKSKNV